MARKFLIVVLLAVGVGLMVWAFTSDGRQEDDPAATSEDADAEVRRAVERFIPQEDEMVPRQSQVGVDLKPGYDADLTIEGHRIPLDQLDKNEPLNQVVYRPGPDKEVRALDAGEMCVVAHVRDLTSPDSPERDVSWCFRVA